MGDFTMPALGADMEVGTVTQWFVQPGATVERGDIVAVVDTEKSTIEVEVFESGVVDRILVGEGEEVPVGTVLAHISTGSDAGETHSPVVRHLAEKLGVDLHAIAGTGLGGGLTRADVERAARPAPVASGTGGGRKGPVRSSPLARRRAAEANRDLSTVAGSGPGGAVLATDLAAPISAIRRPATGTEQRAEAVRRATGLLMARSKREIPHYYLSTTVDMALSKEWLERTNAGRSVTDRLLPAVLLLKATTLAVAKVPEMNGFFVDDRFEPAPTVSLGVAISRRDGGLSAPAIVGAEKLSLDELMGRLRDLVGRARSGALRSSEVSGATITVTNLGDLGVDSVYGVIYPPQVALVGFGRIVERPVALRGLLGVRPTLVATLAADHRASDGHRGGRFLAEIDRLLQEPGKL